MVSPHAAGALGLLASVNKPGSANEVHTLYDQVIAAGNFDWVDDSGDGIHEPFLDVTGFDANMIAGDCGGYPPANEAPSASFTYSCDGMTCSFTDTSTDNDGDIVSWSWEFGWERIDRAESVPRLSSRRQLHGDTQP